MNDTSTVNLSDVTQLAMRDHLTAASALMEAAIGDLRAEDPDAADGANHALRGGALLVLRTTLAFSGLAQVAIELVTPAGDAMTLLSVELHRPS